VNCACPLFKKGSLEIVSTELLILSINYVCLEYTGAGTDAGGFKPG